MKISKKQAFDFALKINKDVDIDDDTFELTFQHIRDDLQHYARKGDVELSVVADVHGPIVYKLYDKYFGGE